MMELRRPFTYFMVNGKYIQKPKLISPDKTHISFIAAKIVVLAILAPKPLPEYLESFAGIVNRQSKRITERVNVSVKCIFNNLLVYASILD